MCSRLEHSPPLTLLGYTPGLCTEAISLVQQTNISNTDVIAISGFSPRLCHGGVLLWNNGSQSYDATVNITNIPYDNFTVQVYVLDANHLPGVSCPPLRPRGPPLLCVCRTCLKGRQQNGNLRQPRDWPLVSRLFLTMVMTKSGLEKSYVFQLSLEGSPVE